MFEHSGEGEKIQVVTNKWHSESFCSDVNDELKQNNNASSLIDKHAPEDRFNLVLFSTYLVGIASLLPWNFFITANDYWMFKLRNVSLPDDIGINEKTKLQTTFTSLLSIASTIPILIAHAFNVYTSHRILPHVRVTFALVISLLITIVTATLTQINTDEHQDAFLQGTIVSTFLINVMGGLLQGSSIGIAGCLPAKYMKAVVFGQSTGGIFAAIAQIIALVTNPHPADSGLAFFLFAVFTLFVTAVSFLYSQRTGFYRYYMATQNVGKFKAKIQSDVSLIVIFKKVFPYAISLFLTFTVTLSVFPGITVLVVSENPHLSIWTGKLFLPICCFLLLNTADFSGRLIGGWIPLPKKTKWPVFIIVFLHCFHIPLLMFCNVHPRRNLPVIFHSDAYFVAFILSMGLFSGYLCTVLFVKGPKQVATENQQAAGTMVAAFQGAGLMIGSLLSYLFINII